MPRAVLLIEDSPEDRETYRRYLARAGDDIYETIEAETIEEGLSLYRRETPDIVPLDYHLPDGTALDFIKEGGKEIDRPIIILTGQEERKIAVESMKAGASDYLVKGN